jgi:anti-anti-sigma factor
MKGGSRTVVQTIKDATVVTIEDSSLVDILHIERLGSELNELVEKRDRRKLVLDITKVAHLSSAALSVLLTVNQAVTKAKGQFILCGASKDIKKLFKITALNKLFTFADTEADGLKKMGIEIPS